MQNTTAINYERVTFSLPKEMNNALDSLKKELNSSKSELIKIAIKRFLEEQEKLKLQKAVELMSKEYENSSCLTEFTVLDSEDFV